jgi:hypothetical protein
LERGSLFRSACGPREKVDLTEVAGAKRDGDGHLPRDIEEAIRAMLGWGLQGGSSDNGSYWRRGRKVLTRTTTPTSMKAKKLTLQKWQG